MLGAILEESPFVDDTSALSARAGGGANVLQRHEDLQLTAGIKRWSRLEIRASDLRFWRKR